MSFRNGSGLKAAVTVLEARKNVGIGNAAPSKPPPDNSQVIRVTLTGADTAVAAGITATGHALLEALIGDDGAGEPIFPLSAASSNRRASR